MAFVAKLSASLSVVCIPPEVWALKPCVVPALSARVGIVDVSLFSITTERARSPAVVVVKLGAVNVPAPAAVAFVTRVVVTAVSSKGVVVVTWRNAAISALEPSFAVPWTVIVTDVPEV